MFMVTNSKNYTPNTKKENRGRQTIKAQKLWYAILGAQTETGTPFMLYKDSCNNKSNQKNLVLSNLPTCVVKLLNILAPDEVAVCNLASIALPSFVENDEKVLGTTFDKLHQVTKVVTRNLNRVIDRNHYPVPEVERSNMRHRPIALVFKVWLMPLWN